MSLFELNKESERLAKLESTLLDYQKARSALDFKGHQNPVSVNINNCVSIVVTEMNQGYMQVPKRGMDMIILGAKKIYNAKISEVRDAIVDSKQKVRQLADDIATQK